METENIIAWLKGYAMAMTHMDNLAVASFITEAYTRLEEQKRFIEIFQIKELYKETENG